MGLPNRRRPTYWDRATISKHGPDEFEEKTIFHGKQTIIFFKEVYGTSTMTLLTDAI